MQVLILLIIVLKKQRLCEFAHFSVCLSMYSLMSRRVENYLGSTFYLVYFPKYTNGEPEIFL